MQMFWYDDQTYVSNYFENIINDGSIDQTLLIQNIIDSHIGEEIKIPTGVYLITHLTIPDGTFLKGEFNTIFKSLSETNIIRILSGVNCLIENIHVLGNNEIIRPTTTGTQVGWYLDNCLSVTLNNCSASGCTDSGIKIKNTGAQAASQYYKIPILNNFKAYKNYIGIKNDVRGEYCQLNGCIAGENFIGYFTGGGNNMASNCQFNRNQNGARVVGGITDGISYPNNSHASFNGCQFNHNINEAIRFENVEVGYMLNGCQFFDGDIVFKGKTKGVIITGSEGGTWSINSESIEQNLITNSFFYTKPSGNWSNTIIHKNNIGTGAIIDNNTLTSINESSLILKSRYDLFKTSNRGISSWKSGGPHIFWGSKDVVIPPNKYVGSILIRLENCGTTFQKECFLAVIDATTELCIDILAKNYFPEIVNLDGATYALIPVKKQFNTHIFFVAGVNRGSSSNEAGMAYGRVSSTNNFAYFSDEYPYIGQKIVSNTNSINCELIICQDYK